MCLSAKLGKAAVRSTFPLIYFDEMGTPEVKAPYVITNREKWSVGELEKVKKLLIYKPANKVKWPVPVVKQKPAKTEKPKGAGRKAEKQREKPIGWDTDGEPLYEVDENLVEEMVSKMNWCPPESPEDVLLVDNDKLLLNLPSESTSTIHLCCNYITPEMLSHLLRILKQDGTVTFTVPANE